MEEEVKTLLDIAQGSAYNDRFEADAIQKYTDFIKIIKKSDLPEDDKEELVSKIEEIISDELNHQKILREIYVKASGIKPNKD